METIKQLISENNFSEVYDLILKNKGLLDKIELLTYEESNNQLFDFICFLGENSKEERIISFASMILATSLCHFEGAYKEAYSFAQKAVLTEPNNLQNLEWLLFFYDLPDNIMNDSELKELVETILKIDNNNEKAIKYLEILKSKPYKIHEGKEYTKEEWQQYQEEKRKNARPGTTWSLLED